ncbi:MAG: hypothetical protein M5R38_01100 [Candidatus Methylomirabilis sp.]|nr:hypothetical protein [Candidatus Methylomirabilis sp.]
MKRQVIAFFVVTGLAAGLALASEWYMSHDHWYAKEPEKDFALARLIADIRLATQRYQDLEQAKADGYVQISGNVPLEGYHFQKAGLTPFDYTHPRCCCTPNGRGAGNWSP